MQPETIAGGSNGLSNGDLASAAKDLCRARGNAPGALIEILHDVQERFGFVPENALPVIASALNLSRAEVFGVFSFYHDFRSKPAGEHVLKLCRAESCQSMGSEALAAGLEKALGVTFGQTSKDGAVTLEAVYCLGNCALSPAAMLDGKPIGRASLAKLRSLLDRPVGASR